ncbi:hypothetical protein [Streptomyces sp. NPDC050560]|uniref:hypothetical protein n=1 Tax=Streptomyces sp. NPDC050560 TaxID=3365630 RepID=UPI0037B79911
MSEFHARAPGPRPVPPPEWDQGADRGSELTDPVVSIRQLGAFEFTRRSHSRIDHALVFATPGGAHVAYLPPRRPGRATVAARRFTAVYEVDTGVHPVHTSLRLPSDNDAFEFDADLDLSWQVVDPALFVGSGQRDVPGLLLAELQLMARPLARQYPIAASAGAEAALARALAGYGPLGTAAGLRARLTLRLRRDQDNIDHQLRLRAIDHTAAERIRETHRGGEHDAAVADRTRDQDARDHARALRQAGYEAELRAWEAEKIAFYQWYLEQGGVHGWALHLAEHPEDSRLVMESLRADQLQLIQSQMQLVRELLGGESAEDHELAEPKRLALRTVSDILTQRLPGVPHGTALPPADPPAPPADWQPPPGYGASPLAPGTGTAPPAEPDGAP